MQAATQEPLAPPTARATDGPHIAALDGVRALGILLVLGLHAGPFFPDTRGGRAVLSVFGYGWAGVDLFFVLSGMLITGILLETKGRPAYYASFYARRSLRIFPLYYIALLILVVGIPLLGGWRHHHPPMFPPRQGWLWTYTGNVAIAANESWSVMPAYTIPFWSLAVEEQFYLVWPFVVAWLAPRALARTAFGMIGAALLLRIVFTLHGAHAWGVYVSTLTRMDALAAGALIAIAARSPAGLAPYRRYVTPVLVGSGIALVALFVASKTSAHEAPLISTFGFTLIACMCAAFIVAVLTAEPGSALRRALEARPVRHLGMRSYGVYVWHSVVFGVLLTQVLAPAAVIVRSAFVRGLLVTALAVVVAVVVADISWVVIESPFLRLKRFVPRPVPRAGGAGTGIRPIAVAVSPPGIRDVAVPLMAAHGTLTDVSPAGRVTPAPAESPRPQPPRPAPAPLAP